jgi:hypothetical protein
LLTLLGDATESGASPVFFEHRLCGLGVPMNPIRSFLHVVAATVTLIASSQLMGLSAFPAVSVITSLSACALRFLMLLLTP